MQKSNGLIILVIMMLLGGCEEPVSDIPAKKKIILSSHAALPIKIPLTESYQAGDRKDPFTKNVPSTILAKPLTSFALESFRLMATLPQNQPPWAFILAPTHRVYQLTLGDEIGLQHGKISKINAGSIEVTTLANGGAEKKMIHLTATKGGRERYTTHLFFLHPVVLIADRILSRWRSS